MKIMLAFVGIFLPFLLSAEDIRPDSSGVPLFEVFELIQTGPDTYDNGPSGLPTHHWKVDDQHPLLVVASLTDLLLEADKKRVRVILNKNDAPVFAKAIQKYGVLGVTAGDTGTVIVSSTPFDGSLTFAGPVAEYLRHRFHIKPNTNEASPSIDSQTKSASVPASP